MADWDDWDRHRRGGYNFGWERSWDSLSKKQRKRIRRYNHIYGYNDAWWYPYWNQWIAPVINPVISWFAPYPVVTPYPYPQTVIPGTYW